jgi:hypothetical protein
MKPIITALKRILKRNPKMDSRTRSDILRVIRELEV